MAHYLILAATSGIGTAVAQLAHAQGHMLFLTGRRDDALATLASDVGTAHASVDLTDFDAVDAVFAQATEQMGRIDGVVNCSGSLLLKAAHLTNREQYDATIAASLTTAFATVRGAGKHMAGHGGGSVVLVSSAAAQQGLANHEAIAAAKAGIIGLTLSAAATYASSNLRVNAVAPGLTQTPLTASLTGNPTSRKFSEAMHALGRLGEAEDVARAILFLLDPANAWITGQVLAVDGGLSRVAPKIKA
ncbi:MAG: 2-deoxy-D-gluconate 3-dehydrogenase [Azospirillum brasilense]|nr:MAG: 2-deoxy-D-gluconate 3-dehydrogenase [Azospirillum brasilense]